MTPVQEANSNNFGKSFRFHDNSRYSSYLDLHCLLRQGHVVFSKRRVDQYLVHILSQVTWAMINAYPTVC